MGADSLPDRRWRENDRVVVTCRSAYNGRVGTVLKTDNGHPLIAFDSPPFVGRTRSTSPAWFLRHEVEEAGEDAH